MKKILTLVLAIALTTKVFALNPSREYTVLPSEYGMDYKEVMIPATDDVKLAAWIFKPAGESKNSSSSAMMETETWMITLN